LREGKGREGREGREEEGAPMPITKCKLFKLIDLSISEVLLNRRLQKLFGFGLQKPATSHCKI